MSDKKTESEAEAARIRALASLLQETGLTEIEIESGQTRIRVSRAASFAAAPAAPSLPANTAAPAAPSVAAPVAPAKHPGAVPSPMVGTAYLCAAPGSPPFVKIGDSVALGQTLMIIEAMKTMNPIASPRAGVVKEIFVSDAQPVEYGEALMIVE
jgi:acetyl-CoA carboxylase biotin carboxyl carrier protein